MPCQLISTQHPLYPAVLNLRQTVLRQPLGMNLFEEDLSDEAHQIIAVYLNNEALLGCVLAKKVDEHTWKLRQMAVAPERQQQGIGQALMRFMKEEARRSGVTELSLHARETALQFYEKLGYTAEGPTFMEVRIPHRFMQKMI